MVKDNTHVPPAPQPVSPPHTFMALLDSLGR